MFVIRKYAESFRLLDKKEFFSDNEEKERKGKNMKKSWLIGMIAVIFTGILAGCVSAIPEKEAAALFVDHLVYQKSEKKFTENFQNGENLSETFKQNEENFQKSFTEGLLSADQITEKDAKEITDLLLAQVQAKATYEVKKITKDGAIRHVTYGVKGLDFTGMMEATSKKLVAKLLEDEALSKDQNKVVAETVRLLKETIPETNAKAKAVDVTVDMQPQNGKWQIVDDQSKEMNNLYLAFVAGVADQETLLGEMTQIMQTIAKQVQEQLEK